MEELTYLILEVLRDLYNFIQFDRELKEESRKKEPLHCTNCTSFICDPTIKFLEIV